MAVVSKWEFPPFTTATLLPPPGFVLRALNAQKRRQKMPGQDNGAPAVRHQTQKRHRCKVKKMRVVRVSHVVAVNLIDVFDTALRQFTETVLQDD